MPDQPKPPAYDPDELVDVATIGERTGRSRKAATDWSNKPGHPEPVPVRAGRIRKLYRWGDVDRFYRELVPSGRGTPKPYEPEGRAQERA